jgi:hypothetical protein
VVRVAGEEARLMSARNVHPALIYGNGLLGAVVLLGSLWVLPLAVHAVLTLVLASVISVMALTQRAGEVARRAEQSAATWQELAEEWRAVARTYHDNEQTRRRTRRARLEAIVLQAPVGNVLYRFTDDHEGLLYIGITNNIARRVDQHRETKPWWGDVAGLCLQYIPSRDQLERAEIAAIRTERPRHNTMHNPLAVRS